MKHILLYNYALSLTFPLLGKPPALDSAQIEVSYDYMYSDNLLALEKKRKFSCLFNLVTNGH